MSCREIISLNGALYDECEQRLLLQALATGRVAGDGPFTTRCKQLLERIFDAEVLLTTSCTHALEMAALLLDLEPGDEVVVPSFTFVSTVNPFILRGLRPVFADIRPDTLNLDERTLPELCNARTKAIVPVHYAGVACEMDSLCELAGRRGIALIEDNAHGLFGSYRGRLLGTFGALAAQSFHETKNLSCGEGGALIINDPRLRERAEILRNKGTDRSKFLRGEVDKYTWVDCGSSYLPSDLLAAVLLGQLEKRERIQARRRRAWDFYAGELRSWSERWNIALPTIPPECDHPSHIFYLLLPSLAIRDDLIAHLRAHGIQSAFHFQPLHLSNMGLRYGGYQGQCPIAERVASTILRLPLHPNLTTHHLARVVDAVTSFVPTTSQLR